MSGGRCRHRWVEAGRKFTPPNPALTSFRSPGGDDGGEVLKILHGFTTVELHCGTCNDVQFRSTPGATA